MSIGAQRVFCSLFFLIQPNPAERLMFQRCTPQSLVGIASASAARERNWGLQSGYAMMIRNRNCSNLVCGSFQIPMTTDEPRPIRFLELWQPTGWRLNIDITKPPFNYCSVVMSKEMTAPNP
jgi:hypothetical protein